MNSYPKRLIEVDLPIKRISEHARREKSIRHGHISTLHIWWARRPLAACRAVICASLWPDPADPMCPKSFRDTARSLMLEWAKNHLDLMSEESFTRFVAIQKNPKKLNDDEELRYALLDFIADFANWDNSTNKAYLETSRALTQTAHEALGGVAGTKPLVVDPFAGGGAIPLEALRVGADAFASDLNPVAVLLNKIVLEYIPKYGQRLADEVRKCGELVKIRAEKELACFYPKGSDGTIPIAYLWARTIRCEGPGCGAEVPLIRSLWLAKKSSYSVALKIIPNPHKKQVGLKIIQSAKAGDVGEGTVRRGAVTCPVCGYTNPVAAIRRQLKNRRGGTEDARMLAVVSWRPGQHGRIYNLPTNEDVEANNNATKCLEKRRQLHSGPLSLVPNEEIDKNHHDVNRAPLYGMDRWGDLFSPRQALANSTIASIVQEVCAVKNDEFSIAVKTILSLAVDRQVDYNSSFVRWVSGGEFLGNTFSRQALSFVTDYAEVYPFSGATGDWQGAIDWVSKCLQTTILSCLHSGHVHRFSARSHLLPDGSAQAFVTDPPYYDSINYAIISEFFYVWLRRLLNNEHPELFSEITTNKADECVVNQVRDKDDGRYRQIMRESMAEGRRILHQSGIGLIVFAHKSTSGWETQLEAMIDAGWVVVASWPIDSEMTARVAAQGQARLASSIHLVVRPRENPEGSLGKSDIGDWRDVLQELPKRIHDWMPRLASEGVVGADAIFACLGPALEVFSRYSRVEKPNGEHVTLKEYLEHVWAAVSREALNMIFEGADATGFEEDSRLTAMWLWTLSAGANGNGSDEEESDEEGKGEEESGKKAKMKGFVLEYDAARKIGQGLGAHLEKLASLVEITGDKARLLPVAERTRFLFGKDEAETPSQKRKKKPQLKFDFFAELEEVEEEGGWGAKNARKLGDTVLDRIHQSMILFAAGRGEALKRFIVEDGVGRDQRFWRMAQALSALYPSHTDEKRWVDGVLARKRGFGF
jgi:putative DNA methylase